MSAAHEHRREFAGAAARLALCAATCAGAHAATPGAIEQFFGPGNTGGYEGLGVLLDNPGVGGANGPFDGYLLVSSDFPGPFAVEDSSDAFLGDYVADGVGAVSFWMKDVGLLDAFNMHFYLGVPLGEPAENMWECNVSALPASDQWTLVFIRLTNPSEAQWTRLVGKGTLAEALSDVRRIGFRYDRPPFSPTPDLISGDLGIDRVRLHPICPGDTNADDVVNFNDLNNVLSTFGQTGPHLSGDVDDSGNVGFFDLNILLTNFGQACS